MAFSGLERGKKRRETQRTGGSGKKRGEELKN
jgi:hypothetical protein